MEYLRSLFGGGGGSSRVEAAKVPEPSSTAHAEHASKQQQDGRPSSAGNNCKDERFSKKWGLQAGSCTSDDGTTLVGWATLRGRRPCNEDKVYAAFHPIEGVPDAVASSSSSSSQVLCAGVFDGHGGPAAASYVRDNLFQGMLGHRDFHRDLFRAVEEAYIETDGRYVELDSTARQDDGCTALTAVLCGRRLVVAHVGDSRGVLGHQGQAVALTEDHKPNRADERIRIERAGGSVIWAGTWRVLGVLAVSRSFGNRQMKQFVIPHPEIREDELTAANTCLILATDGVWDVMTNQEVVDFVQQFEDAEAAARALVAHAYQLGSMDNISCVLALFRFPAEP